MVFYRNLMAAALDIAPDDAMEAVRQEVSNFHMPGSTMPDFQRASLTIAARSAPAITSPFSSVSEASSTPCAIC